MKTLEEYMALPYVPVVLQDEDMEGKPCYRAENPQLPGCMSHGVTPQEAILNLEEARRLYIQTRLDLRLEVPEPAALTIASHSSAETMVLIAPTQVKFELKIRVSAPSAEPAGAEINLPSSYDMLAEQAA